ncbi:hypothetical protein JCM10207_002995 [Rhodosporidiobolus poonsookiae]
MSGLSLWLCPPAASSLPALLRRLADLHGTEHFDPHATLVSDEIVPSLQQDEIIAKVQDGVRNWRKKNLDPLRLRFKDIRTGDRYYQCVLAALHPDAALTSLHASIVAEFSLSSPPPPYFPHLSLIYGDLSAELKNRIVAELSADGTVKAISGGESVAIGGEKEFEPKEILLVKTSGACETWEVLAKIPLEG